MFTFERKLGPSAAHSGGSKRMSQSPAKAPPVGSLWFRGATSSHGGAAFDADVETEAFPPRAPSLQGDFARSIPIFPARIQRKPTISSPGDPYEREADEVADKVMRSAEPATIGFAPIAIQRQCSACEDEEKTTIRAKRAPSANDDSALDVDAAVRTAGQRGEPLPEPTRDFFEPRFGYDFSRVRVHADGEAAGAARGVQARAYTLGSHIVFGSGQYAPDMAEGKRLLAHELTHVVQQGAGSPQSAAPVQRAPVSIQRLGDPAQAPPTMPCPIATSSPAGSIGQVSFAKNSAAITPAAQATLEAIVTSWHGQPGAPQVRVDGYASAEGTQAHNWTLSCDRAMAVRTVLTRPTSTGAPGIPAGSVDVYAQGASAEVSSLPGNRRATVDVAAPAPTAPTPTPETPTPGPVCGPNVTGQVRAAVDRTRTTFGGWGAADREAHCDALDSYRTGAYAWDIVQLHNNAWISGSYRPACATAGATPPCGTTVQIDSDCSYAGSPNYVIFGVMCRLCSDHYTATSNASGIARFTQPEMQSWIQLYKGPGTFSGGSGNFVPSTQWADAGYNGWPAAASPAGDRNTCSPTCPTPFTAPRFTVAWWRNDGLLSSPTRTEI